MLQLDGKRTVTVVAGCGRTGKSTFALRYLVNAKLDARFIFDPEGEYAQRLQLTPARDLFDLAVQLCRGWVVFDPHEMFPGQLGEAFTWFCAWSFACSEKMPGEKVLLVDEVWKYANPQKMPIELATVCQTGSKRGLGLMVNTQLPNKLNGSLLNECSEFVCFRLQFEKALDVAQEFGFDREEIRAMPELQFVSRTDVGAELRGRIKI